MRQPLILCVPNFSEGRRPKAVTALANAVRNVRGAFLLDRHTDPDHHRTVLTVAGPPPAVLEAAFQAARAAERLIDVRRHRGEHPRIGATDVIPLVPLRAISMKQCVTLARRLGRRIGRELDIPVFLYEDAATRPERRNLENIRQGGLAGLASRMETDPAWKPDFGPWRPHPSAGATAVGARLPLIAYNVNLATGDLAIARGIARTIRAAGGGLAGVKAIGVELRSRGLVQVSTNLTNFFRTSPYDAFLAVQTEAEKKGVAVEHSEIVGLVPLEALVLSAKQAFKLSRFDVNQVLEVRLERRLEGSSREVGAARGRKTMGTAGDHSAERASAFLATVSAARPTPGGGSVAALAGASAAALGVKACAVTVRSGTPTGMQVRGIQAALKRLRASRGRLERLIDADAAAYEELIASRRLRRGNDRPGGQRRVDAPLRRAAELPLRIAEQALASARDLRRLLPTVKPSMTPDVRVGHRLAVAACQAALGLVGENIKQLENRILKIDFQNKIRRLREDLVKEERL